MRSARAARWPGIGRAPATGSSNQRIAARPQAPQSTIWRALLASTPPRARTGRPVATASVSATQAARRDPTGLRRGLEDRSEECEIGALIARVANLVHAVRRAPDQERPAGQSRASARRTGAMGSPEAGSWTPSAPAARAMSGTGVDQQDECRGRSGARLGGQGEEIAVAATLAAHLQAVDAGGGERSAPAPPGGARYDRRATDGEQARNLQVRSRCRGAGTDRDRADPRPGGEARKRRSRRAPRR